MFYRPCVHTRTDFTFCMQTWIFFLRIQPKESFLVAFDKVRDRSWHNRSELSKNTRSLFILLDDALSFVEIQKFCYHGNMPSHFARGCTMAYVFEARKIKNFCAKSRSLERWRELIKVLQYVGRLRHKVHPLTPSYTACTVKTEGIPIVCLLMIQVSHTYVRTLNSKALLST